MNANVKIIRVGAQNISKSKQATEILHFDYYGFSMHIYF